MSDEKSPEDSPENPPEESNPTEPEGTESEPSESAEAENPVEKSPPAADDPPSEEKQNASGNHGNFWQTVAIVAGIVLAVLLSLILPAVIDYQDPTQKYWADTFTNILKVGGEIFLDLLKMIVVPLVMASVMAGVLGLGDVRRLGRPGLYTVLYYAATTLLAVGTGILLVNLIEPGTGIEPERVAQVQEQTREKLEDKLQQAQETSLLHELATMPFTDNLLKSMVEMDLLPVIVFSLVFAAVLTTLGPEAKPVTNLVTSISDALMQFVLFLMKLAPIGIFCLVAGRFLEANLEGTFFAELQSISYYVLCVLLGLAIHAFGTIPLILWLTTKRNPYVFMQQMAQALLMAFSTASSSATLPVTMETAETRAGVSKNSIEFVLPIGATINMDGTALYEAVAAIFIAQALVGELSVANQLVIGFTATLAAIGAAGIPEAGLFTMVIVLNAVGLPTESVGLILAVDWFLDRFRTTVNVFGDAAGSAVVDKSFNPEGLT